MEDSEGNVETIHGGGFGVLVFLFFVRDTPSCAPPLQASQIPVPTTFRSRVIKKRLRRHDPHYSPESLIAGAPLFVQNPKREPLREAHRTEGLLKSEGK